MVGQVPADARTENRCGNRRSMSLAVGFRRKRGVRERSRNCSAPTKVNCISRFFPGGLNSFWRYGMMLGAVFRGTCVFGESKTAEELIRTYTTRFLQPFGIGPMSVWRFLRAIRPRKQNTPEKGRDSATSGRNNYLSEAKMGQLVENTLTTDLKNWS